MQVTDNAKPLVLAVALLQFRLQKTQVKVIESASRSRRQKKNKTRVDRLRLKTAISMLYRVMTGNVEKLAVLHVEYVLLVILCWGGPGHRN